MIVGLLSLAGCAGSDTGLGSAAGVEQSASSRGKQPIGSRDSLPGGGAGGVSAGSGVGSGGGITGSGNP